MILYAALFAVAAYFTHGNARIVIGLIIFLLAVKTWTVHKRNHLE